MIKIDTIAKFLTESLMMIRIKEKKIDWLGSSSASGLPNYGEFCHFSTFRAKGIDIRQLLSIMNTWGNCSLKWLYIKDQFTWNNQPCQIKHFFAGNQQKLDTFLENKTCSLAHYSELKKYLWRFDPILTLKNDLTREAFDKFSGVLHNIGWSDEDSCSSGIAY